MNVGPVTLRGRFVTLEPLGLEHAPGLVDLLRADPATLTYFSPMFSPESHDPPAIARYIERRRTIPGTLPFAVIDHASGVCVGSTSYLEIRPQDRGLEIGATFYHAAHRGTRTNPECKLLLLAHAFETLGCERVQLKCDARNVRSRAAILKLGAQFEGILRHVTALGGGAYRDTAYFSILRGEWPGVRRGLEARLDAAR